MSLLDARFALCPNPRCLHAMEFEVVDNKPIAVFCTKCKHPLVTACPRCLSPFVYKPEKFCSVCSVDFIKVYPEFYLGLFGKFGKSQKALALQTPEFRERIQGLYHYIPVLHLGHSYQSLAESLKDRGFYNLLEQLSENRTILSVVKDD